MKTMAVTNTVEMIGFPSDASSYFSTNPDLKEAVGTDIHRLDQIRDPAILERLQQARVIVCAGEPEAYGVFGAKHGVGQNTNLGTEDDPVFGGFFDAPTDAHYQALIELGHVSAAVDKRYYEILPDRLLVLFAPGPTAGKRGEICFPELLGVGGGIENVSADSCYDPTFFWSRKLFEKWPKGVALSNFDHYAGLWQRSLEAEDPRCQLFRDSKVHALPVLKDENNNSARGRLLRMSCMGRRWEILLLPDVPTLDDVFAVLQPLLAVIGIRTHGRESFERARAKVQQQYHPSGKTAFPIVGDSLALQSVYETILAASLVLPEAHIFIEGETGTGKELIVDVLAGMGKGVKGTKYIPINCAALTGATATSELFGHVRGAFTGAIADHEGIIAEAGSGILFIDEVQFLDPRGRGKLLRLLQDGTYSRLGDPKERKSKARIVAATNDLKFRKNKKVRSSGFIQRFDYVISLPPLRDRFGDIELLIVHFVKEFAEPLMSVDEVDPGDDADVGEWLHRTCPYWRAWMYDEWTDSNIRGLRNAVRRWVADCQVQRLLTSDQSEVVNDPVEKVDRREPRGRPLTIPGPEILRILRKVSEDNGNIEDVFSMLVVKDKLYYQRPSSLKRRILGASDLDDKEKGKALRFIEDLG